MTGWREGLRRAANLVGGSNPPCRGQEAPQSALSLFSPVVAGVSTAARSARVNKGFSATATSDYGPENPTGTPPGARTTAIVTPGMMGVGATTASAPSRRAASNEARASATCTVKLLPGVSDGLVCRIPPPPRSEYANSMYSAPPGIGTLGLNVQPRTLAHQAFVATGSELTSSVWVIQP